MKYMQSRILARLGNPGPDENLHLSGVVVFELACGSHKGRWRMASLELLEKFLLDFAVVSFDERAARAGGAIRAELERKGWPSGPMDTLIAAHAVSLGLPLVTHNVRELSRVPGLRVENWAGK